MVIAQKATEVPSWTSDCLVAAVRIVFLLQLIRGWSLTPEPTRVHFIKYTHAFVTKDFLQSSADFFCKTERIGKLNGRLFFFFFFFSPPLYKKLL